MNERLACRVAKSHLQRSSFSRARCVGTRCPLPPGEGKTDPPAKNTTLPYPVGIPTFFCKPLPLELLPVRRETSHLRGVFIRVTGKWHPAEHADRQTVPGP